MPENNYFNYTNHHYELLRYLLSFAEEKHQGEDPLLSSCAKELIRYILGIDKTKSVVAGFDNDIFSVNDDKYILIGGSELYEPDLDLKENIKDWYCVHYDPSTSFTMVQSEGSHVLYLSMKKLREISGKYPSKNPMFLQYIQFLDEHAKKIEETLQIPMKQWDENDYRRFSAHLVEDSVIDMTGSVAGERIYMENYYPNPKYSHSLFWYYISDDKLESMGVQDHVRAIHLYTRLNTINIRYVSDDDGDPYVQKLRSFVKKIHQMPIFFNLSNYKEAIQCAQSIMDRLAEEFRL